MPLLPMDRCTDIVKYLLSMVLWLKEDNDAWKCLVVHFGTEQHDIYRVMEMQFNEIRDLASAPNARGKTQALQKGVAMQIINFIKMYWSRVKDGTPMDGDLLTITPDEFEEIKHDLRAQQIEDSSGTAPPPTPAVGSHSPGPLQDFQKGIR